MSRPTFGSAYVEPGVGLFCGRSKVLSREKTRKIKKEM